jgi:hypothetical protein
MIYFYGSLLITHSMNHLDSNLNFPMSIFLNIIYVAVSTLSFLCSEEMDFQPDPV